MFQSFFLSRNVVTYQEARSVVECSMRLSVLIGLAVVLFSGVALADSPHFTSSSGALDADGNLAVSFKEAGLGSNVNINYVLSADSSANYGCINNGGKN